ncbi:hypothetical protein QQP08_009391 [Theobroma cacao]|nr:hypothetical protein QQP08_009391 [Theobroma cacao]
MRRAAKRAEESRKRRKKKKRLVGLSFELGSAPFLCLMIRNFTGWYIGVSKSLSQSYLFLFPCQAARMKVDMVICPSVQIGNSAAQFGEIGAVEMGVDLVYR